MGHKKGTPKKSQAPPAHVESSRTVSRRKFFQLTFGFLGATTGLLATVPVVGFLSYASDEGAGPAEIPETALPSSGALLVRHMGRPAYVFRHEGQIMALSAVCTHLGCTVSFSSDQEKFTCPCHGAAYALSGQVEKGPATQPLATIKVTLEQGVVKLGGMA